MIKDSIERQTGGDRSRGGGGVLEEAEKNTYHKSHESRPKLMIFGRKRLVEGAVMDQHTTRLQKFNK